MSLLGSLAKKVKKTVTGAAKGFATGGLGGAVAGGLGGIMGAPSNPKKTKNIGIQPQVNTTKALITNLQPVSTPVVSQYSASNLVRLASTNALQPIPNALALAPNPMGGGGATGTWSGQGAMPSWAYHRLYTKKGTPRRTRRDGMPFAPPRMNPMNVRAARRAVRRIRSARKLLQRIERSLPKQTHHRRAAAAR